MSTKVTIVVPSYNSETVIGQCMDSILAQTFKDFEVIVVDDESTDNTVAIAQEYAEKDSRVKVVPKKHENAGISRNVGIDMAEGDYIVFWDSDDYFELNALELMYNKCIEDDADICLCDAWHYNEMLQRDENGLKIDPEYLPEKIPFSRKDIPDTIYNVTANVPWNKMFRLKFINDNKIRFQSLPKANDAYFNLMTMALADSITVVNEKLVHWRYNQEMKSTTTDSKRSPMHVFEAFEAAYKDLNDLGVYEEIRMSFLNKALGSYLYVLSCQQGLDNLDNFRQVYDYIRDKGLREFGFDTVKEEDVQKQKKFERLQYVVDGSYEEYILWREAANKQSLNNRCKNAFAKIRRREEKIERLENKIERLQAKIERLNQKYDRMKNSFAYRVGMKVTWLPRKINALINGKPDTSEKKEEKEEVIENEVENIIENEQEVVIENDSENEEM